MGIRVLVVDDHMIMREGICSLLDKQPDIEVVGEAENGRIALELTKELMPDVVLMDLNMPELNGIEATRRIASQFPASRALIFSAYSDRHQLLEVLKAGAKGFIMKSCISIRELVLAIRTVAADKNYFSPAITESILMDYMKLCTEQIPSSVSLISSREREILQLLAEGKNAKEIAFILKVSPKTVDTHRQHIMKKLRLCSVAEITKFAIREGLTTL